MCESDDLLHVWPCPPCTHHAHAHAHPKTGRHGGSQWARRRLPALLLPLLLLLLLQDR